MLLMIFSLSACTGTNLTDSGSYGNNPPSDSGDGSSSNGLYFEPEFIGFELVAGWDEYRDRLIGWNFNGAEYEPNLRIILANRSYLDGRDPGFQDPDNVCELAASLDVVPAPLQIELNEPLDNEVIELRGSYEGTVSIFGYDGGACEDFDPAIWQDGEPRSAFEGMHIGVGLGDMTDFLSGQWQPTTLGEYGRHMLGSFFAFNQYDENGDLKFVAKDRSTSLVWQLSADSELLINTEGSPIGQDINDPYIYAWLSGYAWFYESLDDLALDRLDEVEIQ